MANTYGLGTNVWFNDNQLNSISGIGIVSADPYEPPRRTLAVSNIAHSDKSKTSSAFYTSRRISVVLSIARNSKTEAEQALDSLNAMIQGIEKTLLFQQSGSQRKYTATLESATVKNNLGGYMRVELMFVCSDNYGYDTALTSLLNETGETDISRNDALTFAGTAMFQLPIITVDYSAISGGTAKTVTIGNGGTGQAITVTRDWVADDVLVINVQERTVTVNGSAVDYSGAFPEFVVGAGNLTYLDNFTTRTYDIRAQYYKRYV